MRRPKIVFLVFAVSVCCCCFGQQLSKRMTNQDVIDMVSLGLPDDVIISKIRAISATDFDTDVPGLRALKLGRVSDSVIRVMISPASSYSPTPRPAEAAASPNKSESSRFDPYDPLLEVGVYLLHDGKPFEVQPEIVNWQTGGVLKNAATFGIVKEDRNARVMRGKSSIQGANPLVFVIKTMEGTSVEEYQLLKLHEKSNRREFRSVTGGILHVSGGAQRDQIAFQAEKVGSRTWKIALQMLPMGEYGFLPPGLESASISASGKMYTFGVVPEILGRAAAKSAVRSEIPEESTAPDETNSLNVAKSTIGASSDDNPTVRHDGVTLSRVEADGPADRAGIKVGDVILAIDDHYLYTGQDMSEEILRHKPGTKISLRCRHARTMYEASVVVAAAQ